MTARLDLRQHAGENLEPEVLFVAQPVRATLEDADLVVQPLDEAERDLVLRAAVGRDPLPVPFNHRGELLVGAQALPLERRAPVLEEPARPALPPIVPELPERFLEQVRGVQPLVGGWRARGRIWIPASTVRSRRYRRTVLRATLELARDAFGAPSSPVQLADLANHLGVDHRHLRSRWCHARRLCRHVSSSLGPREEGSDLDSDGGHYCDRPTTELWTVAS